MKTLLLHLSWFLLALSILLSVAVIMTMLLRKKRPEAALWASRTSLALSCVAIVSVILTMGYMAMKADFEDNIKLSCADFGMKANPNLTSYAADRNSEVNTNAASVLWLAFIEYFPKAEKWLRWIAVGLCLSAVISFAIVLKSITTEDARSKNRKIKKSHATYLNNLIKNSQPMGYKKMECQISFISKDDFLGKKSRAAKPKLSIRDVWTAYAALGVFCAAVVGVILLNHYIQLMQREALQRNCVPLDNAPQEIASSEGDYYAQDTDEPRFYGRPFHIISREEWMAGPLRNTRPLKRPVHLVVVLYTAAGSCNFLKDCFHLIQKYSMDGGWDVPSNFLVSRDGRVYEGRGWNTTADDPGLYKKGGLVVLFMGATFPPLPLEHQLKAFDELIEEGLLIGSIAKDYKVTGLI